MVKGIATFKEYFKDHTDNYILIGGAACDEQLEDEGLTFRATKDLDIILIIEALNDTFVEKFWEFITDGKYDHHEKGQGKNVFYRFMKPETDNFPYQIEIFARTPDIEGLSSKSRYAPIPVSDELSSLSAILMDDDYYHFTMANSQKLDQLHLASNEALICLKARAWLDLKTRKEAGESIESKKVKKHRLDILRLAVTLSGDDTIKLPGKIKNDVSAYLKDIEANPPDIKPILQGLGLPATSINVNKIIDLVKQTFVL
jgi:hypothetical protein